MLNSSFCKLKARWCMDALCRLKKCLAIFQWSFHVGYNLSEINFLPCLWHSLQSPHMWKINDHCSCLPHQEDTAAFCNSFCSEAVHPGWRGHGWGKAFHLFSLSECCPSYLNIALCRFQDIAWCACHWNRVVSMYCHILLQSMCCLLCTRLQSWQRFPPWNEWYTYSPRMCSLSIQAMAWPWKGQYHVLQLARLRYRPRGTITIEQLLTVQPVREALERALRHICTEAKVVVIGSHKTGLTTHASAIDLTVSNLLGEGSIFLGWDNSTIT